MHETMVRLYEAAKKLKRLETPTEVARALNQSQQTINNWERRGISQKGMLIAQAEIGCSGTWLQTGVPPMEAVKPRSGATQIETKLNVSHEVPAYNVPSGTSGAMESTVGEPLQLRQGRDIPVVGEAQGGPDGYISINDYPVGHGEGWITLYSADPGAYGLRVRGDSMRPRIKSGEHIVVEPGIEAQPGDDVVVEFLDGSAVVKELLWIREGEACLGSINNGIPPITRPLDTIRSIHRVSAIIPRGSPLYRPAM